VCVVTAGVGALRWEAARRPTAAGFWFADEAFSLPAAESARLGGPLTSDDVQVIARVSRAELERAYSGMRVSITDNRRAFWRVEVRQDLDVPDNAFRNGPPSGAGESIVLGPLGGRGTVSFLSLAQSAIRFAPANASRGEILAGIGRGIGRATAHELAHQIIGGSGHNPDDASSYEYPWSDRAVQYYGELHWSIAEPALRRRLGGD
jgi:hypothetical protein